MIALVLAASLWPGVSTDRIYQALKRDGVDVAQCANKLPSDARNALTLQAISSNPRLVMVDSMGGGWGSCLCSANNCPFWVYRVDDSATVQVLEGATDGLKLISARGDPIPEVDSTAQSSAALHCETVYRYVNGKYVEAQTFTIYHGVWRKPDTVPLRFAPGATSARVSGKIAGEFGDDYTFEAAKGQLLGISDVSAEFDTLIRLRGPNFDRALSAGHAVRLPATGTYHLSVDLPDLSDPAAAYGFTLSIR